MKKLTSKSILLLPVVLMLAACGSSSDPDDDSLNYTPVNYTSLNYRPYVYSTPFYQAIDFSKNLVNQKDPSAFLDVNFSGQVDSLMPDSRNDLVKKVAAFQFNAVYQDKTIDIYVNPEFGSYQTAQQKAIYYADIIGQIPAFLRSGIDKVYLNQGFEPLVGSGNHLVIYNNLADILASEGILEETLIRESVHVSLDDDLANSSEWQFAQNNDGVAISQLAAHLSGEDAAESLLAYLTVRYRSNRVPASVVQTIVDTIPNRIDYLDSSGFTMHPLAQDQSAEEVDTIEPEMTHYSGSLFSYYQQWENKVSF